MTHVTIRWFASAREAAGTSETTLPLGGDTTAASALSHAADGNDRLQRIIGVASLLADGAAVTDRHAPLAARTLDVLPPFAGG